MQDVCLCSHSGYRYHLLASILRHLDFSNDFKENGLLYVIHCIFHYSFFLVQPVAIWNKSESAKIRLFYFVWTGTAERQAIYI
jgi:hypothetical protein